MELLCDVASQITTDHLVKKCGKALSCMHVACLSVFLQKMYWKTPVQYDQTRYDLMTARAAPIPNLPQLVSKFPVRFDVVGSNAGYVSIFDVLSILWPNSQPKNVWDKVERKGIEHRLMVFRTGPAMKETQGAKLDTIIAIVERCKSRGGLPAEKQQELFHDLQTALKGQKQTPEHDTDVSRCGKDTKVPLAPPQTHLSGS